jgi:type I restriction enzyme S subunit
MKPYPKYKNSGVEWLGEVPEHWMVTHLKTPFNSANGGLFKDGDWIESVNISDDGIRYITTGNVGEGIYKEQGDAYISEEIFHKLSCTEVCPGDILISRLNKPIGRACIVPDLGCRVVTSVDNVICRVGPDFYAKYIVYRFTASDYWHELGLIASGATMQRIGRKELGYVRVAWPPLPEQQAIAVFLDAETARIDSLISDYESLIALLREERQAVISHAVTKGLNPDVPMKDSGVEWLGQVPEHWDVMPLKRIASLCTERSNATLFPVALDNIESWSGRYIENNAEYESAGTAFQPGDILFGKLRPYLAKVWLADRPGEAVGDFHVIRTWLPNIPAFLLRLLLSRDLISLIDGSTYGAKMPRASWEFIGSLPIPIPTSKEQQAIAAFLDAETARIDSLIADAEKAIELLRESRTALISDAVTGKIDVRDWQQENA